MKKSIYVIVICIAVTACKQHGPDSVSQADSANMTRDSNENRSPATPPYEISGIDAKFAAKAAAGGMEEVELGMLALARSNTPGVKTLADMMQKDHSKANTELKAIASARHIVLPDRLSNDAAALKKSLSSYNDKEFDKAYVKAMVKDHKNDISEFTDALKVVKYPEMTAFIKKTIPVLQMHLQAAEKLEDQMVQ
ncbi:DUF4142 domain-containing protein [Mucilaginibacter ginkgonis]|uniref:DUF4142 domain-containing protein n=1 Tax=Mucilaginibacter ginkgonis TaxID=2682091 RepID=A0A7T7FDA8_9SPHI|nr:DUF4142 domain-containing protein [Mucilaginibacter ginkgonis]QQL51246.1 DUF4142 domain-containing protein [Mucilaginibacter ginkgonis]